MIVKSKIKYINSLGDKKLRDAERVFVAEGPKIINELLGEYSSEPREIFALKGWMDQQQNLSELFTEIDEVMLGRLSFLSTPNQVIGIFAMPVLKPLTLTGKISIVLDGIQDPGNLGTIIRCADWFGVEQVICSRDSADIYNPKAVQATMGSIARVKVYYEDIAAVLQSGKETPVYAASMNGKDLKQMDTLKEGVIIIGNESKGISNEILELSDERITIMRKGKAESLNAAIATGIILSHLIP